jgi:Tfp pilus assembly protein PilZ
MWPTETKGSHWDRRAAGLLRVPLACACRLTLEGAAPTAAALVNINVLGAYLASDERPALGHGLQFSFRAPDGDGDVEIHGAVTWVNPPQQHPFHSLPPGFGVKFTTLADEDRQRVEAIVRVHTEPRQHEG